MAKKPLNLRIVTNVSIGSNGPFELVIKLDGDHFLKEWGNCTDKEIKELLLQDVESAVMERLSASPCKGELVKAVSKLRKAQGK